MAFSSSPWGNAASFAGIPWQISNPNYNPNQFAIGGALGSMGGATTPQSSGGAPTMDNPQAYGYAGQIEGIAGQLGKTGAGALNAAQQTQGQVGGLANQLVSLGQGLTTQFAGNLPYADKALSEAFDPMKTAYNYYLNQNQDQTAAAAAQSGFAGTPYAAEVQNAGTGTFQNAWQTAQIGREATGAATAEGLQQQYEAGVLGGAGLINEAGQLDLGALSGVLQAYGLQGNNLAQAGQLLQGLLSSLGISESAPSGASLQGPASASASPTGA